MEKVIALKPCAAQGVVGKMTFGGTVELSADGVDFDAHYTFIAENGGVTYTWVDVKPWRAHGTAVFDLKPQPVKQLAP